MTKETVTMLDYLFPHFLSDPREYGQAESLWQQRWQDLLSRVGQEGQWQTPWVNTHSANGTPCRDGNPIFSAVSPSRRLAVRIIQLEPTDDAKEFHVWKDTFAEAAPEAAEELVISCVLTDQTLREAEELMRQWITVGEISLPTESKDGPISPTTSDTFSTPALSDQPPPSST